SQNNLFHMYISFLKLNKIISSEAPMLRFVSHTPKPSALNAALLQGLIFKSVTFMVVSASC
uniref:hypothetical protein n=1 Tax=Alcaligenes xylosoxydans xylosoxydans TaxID=85698 RepID=UPI001EECCBAF